MSLAACSARCSIGLPSSWLRSYEELRRVVRRGRYVHADETGQPILDKDQCFRGWMWVILSQQAIVYHYSDHRDAATAEELLGDTSGNLTIDGYAAYNGLSEKKGSRYRSGCWGHGRRKFYEAIPADKKRDHENLELLRMITELYKVEDEARDARIEGTREHLELRQRKNSRSSDRSGAGSTPARTSTRRRARWARR